MLIEAAQSQDDNFTVKRAQHHSVTMTLAGSWSVALSPARRELPGIRARRTVRAPPWIPSARRRPASLCCPPGRADPRDPCRRESPASPAGLECRHFRSSPSPLRRCSSGLRSPYTPETEKRIGQGIGQRFGVAINMKVVEHVIAGMETAVESLKREHHIIQ